MRKLLLFCLSVLIFTSWAEAQVVSPSSSNILYVDQNVTAGGSESGDSWGNAIHQLADALKYAKQQDSYTSGNPLEIYVAKGTYKPMYSPEDGTNNLTDQVRGNSFLMVNNVQLYGGFDPANGVVDLSDSRILPSVAGSGNGSILSGDLNDNDALSSTPPSSGNPYTQASIADNVYHVVVSSGDVGTAKLDGFTLTGGNTDGANLTDTVIVNGNTIIYKNGGGLFNYSSSPSLINVLFNGNTATGAAGGIFNHIGSSPSMTDVYFNGNTASQGGGMFNSKNSNPSLTQMVFNKNKAIKEGGGMRNANGASPIAINVTFSGNEATRGGGIYNDLNSSPSLTAVTFSENNGVFGGAMGNNRNSSPSLNNVSFSDNEGKYGGAMYNNNGSSPSLTNVTFSGNTATNSGGAMTNRKSSPILNDVIFSGNNGKNGGGMRNDVNASPILTHVIFSENNAGINGGGMYNSDSSSPSLTNVLFKGNTSLSGGGIYNNYSSSPSLTNVTISGNTATQKGGGILNKNSSSPIITNSIVYGNTATIHGSGIQNFSGSTPTITYSLIQNLDNTGNNGLDGTNPNVSAQFTDALNGNYSLKTNSPAINAGSNGAYTNAGGDLSNDLDLADNPRVYDGIPSTDIIDLGAYEFQGEVGDVYVYENGSWTPQDPSGVSTTEDAILVINGSTSLTADTEIGKLTVRDGATLKTGDVLTVAIDIIIDGSLVFTSDANSTGQLGVVPSGANITGNQNITVQRFIPAGDQAADSGDHLGRAYRFMTSAVNTTGSIHANWQEGATSYTANPKSGYGTHITGLNTIPGNTLNEADVSKDQQLGFDYSITGNPSLYVYDNTNQAFSPIANTDSKKLFVGEPYQLFVRGDRSIDVTNSAATPTNTILEATGKLQIGDFAISDFGENEDDFNFFGNPYQAAVDMTKVVAHSTNINPNSYIVYDPTINTRGGFVTVELTGNAGSNSAGSDANQFLQAGQAAFVTTDNQTSAPELLFKETDKATGEPQTDVFSVPNNSFINMQLLQNAKVIDGLRIYFDQNGDNEVRSNDAPKYGNLDENLAVVNDENYLSIEHRALPTEEEILPLYVDQYRNASYSFKAEVPEQLGEVTAYLDDAYLNTHSVLPSGETTVVSFDVDQDIAESIASDRFSLSFEPNVLDIKENDRLSFSLWPNPTQNRFNIQVPTTAKGGQVDVTIYSIIGQQVYHVQKTANRNTITIENANLSSGVYMVQMTIDGSTSKAQKLIIE